MRCDSFVSVCTTGKMAAPENSSGYSKKIKDNFISILTLLQTAHLFLNALLFHFIISVVVLKTFRQLYSSATAMCYTRLSSLPKPLFGFLSRVQLGWQVLKPKTAQTSRMRVTLPWLHCHYHLTFPLVNSMAIEWLTRHECYVASSYATICFYVATGVVFKCRIGYPTGSWKTFIRNEFKSQGHFDHNRQLFMIGSCSTIPSSFFISFVAGANSRLSF